MNWPSIKFWAALGCFALIGEVWAQVITQPTLNFNTTIALETGPNGSGCFANLTPPYCTTSPFPLSTAAGNTTAQTAHPVPVPGNISPLSVKTLAYVGYNGRAIVHYQPWFKPGGSHLNVGYDETSTTVVHAQLNAMRAEGWDTAEPDWYGSVSGGTEETVSELVATDAANRCSGSTCPIAFEIMYDYGALTRAGVGQTISSSGQENAILAALKADYCYLNGHYFANQAYLKINGRPLLVNFNYESGTLTGAAPSWQDAYNQLATWFAGNWQSSCPAGQQGANGTPLLLYENQGGFQQDGSTVSGGAFAWPQPLSWSNTNQYLWNGAAGNYLDNFLSAGFTTYPAEFTLAGVYPGFDDNNASWGTNRVIARQCGQVWLNTFQKINARFNSVHPLNGFGAATWNDDEEGSGIENGIDNCVGSFTSSQSGNSHNWTLTFSDATYGTMATIDHMRLLCSLDGTNYAIVNDALTAVASGGIDLSTLGLPGGTWHCFVKAIGKPMIFNHADTPQVYVQTSVRPGIKTAS